MLNIVLVEPEIPQNCGNIARTCAATGSSLHLIRPLGFDISDRAVKRAGLDYWHLVDVYDYDGLDDFFRRNPQAAEDMCFDDTEASPSAKLLTSASPSLMPMSLQISCASAGLALPVKIFISLP